MPEKGKAPVHLGQMAEIRIDGLGHDGEGVGRVDGFAVFVPGVIPGDLVLARITLVKKSYARAESHSVITPSPDRVLPGCPAAASCGGCALLHMNYRSQLEWKRQLVLDALTRIGGFHDVPVQPVLGMEDPAGYRNKGQYPVGLQDGALVTGFYARGSHRIIPCDACLIQHPLNNTVVREARRIAGALELTAYNENDGTGFLRHILAKVSFSRGEVMCVLVTNQRDFPRSREFCDRLLQAVPQVVSIVQNVNPERTNVILGRHTHVLRGQPCIEDELLGLRFRISAESFYQVNPMQTAVLYRKVLEYAVPGPDETAIDLYCGIGTITLALARHVQRVYGIEFSAQAVADATANAQLNGIGNVHFYGGDAGLVLRNLADEGRRFDFAVLDPPRAGCDAGVLRTLAALEVDRMVYVSCNPSSLARDLKLLSELGYLAAMVQPVDMFPHTSHVECVVLILRADKQKACE